VQIFPATSVVSRSELVFASPLAMNQQLPEKSGRPLHGRVSCRACCGFRRCVHHRPRQGDIALGLGGKVAGSFGDGDNVDVATGIELQVATAFTLDEN
jgi:hypothetical protein